MKVHPFTESGLGYGPFNFVRMNDHGKVSVSCDHCGTPLRYEFIVRSGDGNEFGVGCECIRKTGDKGLSDVADAEMIKVLKAQRQAKQREKRQKQIEESNRKWAEGAAEREARRKEFQAKEKAFMSAWGPIISVLKNTRGNFANDIHWNLTSQMNPPRGRALDICFEIYGKQFGRKNSKNYEKAVSFLHDSLKAGNWI